VLRTFSLRSGEFIFYSTNPGNLNSHVKAVHKLQDFTVGKRNKIFKKEFIFYSTNLQKDLQLRFC